MANKKINRISKLVEEASEDSKASSTAEVTNSSLTENASARDILNMVESGELVEDEDDEKIVVNKEPVKVQPQEEKKPQKVYDQHDLILCRNISSSWLKMTGKSGISYVWNATGDVCEVEYGDLWARKTAKSQYLYEPYILIEDDELLEQPRWSDLKKFYEEKVYGLDDVEKIIAVPSSALRKVLTELPNGMKRAVAIRAAVMVEDGRLDSLKKIKIIDDVCGTDIMSIIPD